MRGKWLISAIIMFLTLGGAYHASAAGPVGKQLAQATQVQEQVNINEANADTLQKVQVGVGLSKAEAIVSYREANGRFYSAEELTAVKGIGKSTVRKNRDRIVVE